MLVKVHEAKKNDFTYGFGFEVINRGGSIPSGTVALPNLPPVGLPSNFKTSQTTFYGPRGTSSTPATISAAKASPYPSPASPAASISASPFYYIDPNFRWSPWKATTSFSA